ncbi:hypothetical protein LLEC1_05482 [Akanthomyces lecanii]|uniref:Uncharacterized protein n=1 Tax=Cordyceps confragosa TaxID=2714763 RepID=A0A179I4J1_CORDF|nr:hypothetical protein LLEC1_05482 [Akanthomyces lecanii]
MADIGLIVESRPPARKRRRVVISCFECHRRKQKWTIDWLSSAFESQYADGCPRPIRGNTV